MLDLTGAREPSTLVDVESYQNYKVLGAHTNRSGLIITGRMPDLRESFGNMWMPALLMCMLTSGPFKVLVWTSKLIIMLKRPFGPGRIIALLAD